MHRHGIFKIKCKLKNNRRSCIQCEIGLFNVKLVLLNFGAVLFVHLIFCSIILCIGLDIAYMFVIYQRETKTEHSSTLNRYKFQIS